MTRNLFTLLLVLFLAACSNQQTNSPGILLQETPSDPSEADHSMQSEDLLPFPTPLTTVEIIVSDMQFYEIMEQPAEPEKNNATAVAIITQPQVEQNTSPRVKQDPPPTDTIVVIVDQESVAQEPQPVKLDAVSQDKAQDEVTDNNPLQVSTSTPSQAQPVSSAHQVNDKPIVIAETPDSVNVAPLANPDFFAVPSQLPMVLDVLANDTGLGDEVTLEIIRPPDHGTASIQDGQLLFEHSSAFPVEDSLVYQVSDRNGDSSITNVTLQLNCDSNCGSRLSLNWSPSPTSNVVSYKVYVGKNKQQFDESFKVGNVTEAEYLVTQKGIYFFAVTAMTDDNLESEFSEIIAVRL